MTRCLIPALLTCLLAACESAAPPAAVAKTQTATFALGFPLLNTPVYLRRKPALLAGDSRVRLREYREVQIPPVIAP